jgi:hypothetical protein
MISSKPIARTALYWHNPEFAGLEHRLSAETPMLIVPLRAPPAWEDRSDATDNAVSRGEQSEDLAANRGLRTTFVAAAPLKRIANPGLAVEGKQ